MPDVTQSATQNVVPPERIKAILDAIAKSMSMTGRALGGGQGAGAGPQSVPAQPGAIGAGAMPPPVPMGAPAGAGMPAALPPAAPQSRQQIQSQIPYEYSSPQARTGAVVSGAISSLSQFASNFAKESMDKRRTASESAAYTLLLKGGGKLPEGIATDDKKTSKVVKTLQAFMSGNPEEIMKASATSEGQGVQAAITKYTQMAQAEEARKLEQAKERQSIALQGAQAKQALAHAEQLTAQAEALRRPEQPPAIAAETKDVRGPDGQIRVMQFNTKTGTYDKDLGVSGALHSLPEGVMEMNAWLVRPENRSRDAADYAVWKQSIHPSMEQLYVELDSKKRAGTATADERGKLASIERYRTMVTAATFNLNNPTPSETEVAFWAKASLDDPKNFTLIQRNKVLAQAVTAKLAEGGVTPLHVTAQIKDMAMRAGSIMKHADVVRSTIDGLDAKGQLGPLASRWNEFMTGTYGKGPEFEKLRANVKLLMSGMGMVHGGARGGGSITMVKNFESVLNVAKMDTATLKSGVDVFHDWLKGYAELAPGYSGITPGAAKEPSPESIIFQPRP